MSDEGHELDESIDVKAAGKNEADCGSRCPGDNGQCRKACTKNQGHSGNCHCPTHGDY
jgi:hypothetical protein